MSSITHSPALPLDYQSPIAKKPAGPGKWLLRIFIGGALFMAAVSVLLPSLCKARETPNRAKCASNLHQIGLAILLYTNDHNGVYPDSLATIMREEQITAAVFVCPSSNDEAASGDTQADVIANMSKPHHCSYVYVGNGLSTATAKYDRVICYEQPENHQKDGMNMLFGDGHAEWMNMPMAKTLIAKATAATQPVVVAEAR
jgi:prepilin-type processing-associated H-X9-DG protein